MKLYEKLNCAKCDGTGLMYDIAQDATSTCPHCDAGVVWKELSPADLEVLNLRAVKVLGDMKKWLAWWYNTWGASDSRLAPNTVLHMTIKELELFESKYLSPSALADLQEERVKARAWEILFADDGNRAFDNQGTFEDYLNDILTEARKDPGSFANTQDKKGEPDEQN